MKSIYQGATAPCKGCEREEKSIGCHGVCAEYKEYARRMEEAKADRKRTREISETMFWLSQRRHRR